MTAACVCVCVTKYVNVCEGNSLSPSLCVCQQVVSHSCLILSALFDVDLTNSQPGTKFTL